jgi:hypothetical protein
MEKIRAQLGQFATAPITAKMRAVLGYICAALTIPLVMSMFALIMGEGLGEMVVSATGLRLAPDIDGGEVMQTIDHGTYRTQVHRMVFDALIGERRKGFIQVDWLPAYALPAMIDQEIDADGDGQADFRLQVDTAGQRSTLTPYVPWVVELQGTYALEDALAVRVDLLNPSR